MKSFAKILTALAAVAGAVYVVATYGEQLAAWARKVLDLLPKCPTEEPEEAAEEAEAEEVAEEAPAAEEAEAAEEVAEEPAEPAEEPAPEVVVAENEPVAEDNDFAD